MYIKKKYLYIKYTFICLKKCFKRIITISFNTSFYFYMMYDVFFAIIQFNTTLEVRK